MSFLSGSGRCSEDCRQLARAAFGVPVDAPHRAGGAAGPSAPRAPASPSCSVARTAWPGRSCPTEDSGMAVGVAQQGIAARQHPARIDRAEADRRRLEAAGLARQRRAPAGVWARAAPASIAAPRRARSRPRGRTEALRQQVEPVAAPRQGLARPRQAQGDPVEALRLALQPAAGAPDERGAMRIEQLAAPWRSPPRPARRRRWASARAGRRRGRPG